MWIKYRINDFKYPIGFKVNTETNEVVFGGPTRLLEIMFDILQDYFNRKNLEPIKTNSGRTKFLFSMKYQIVFGVIRRMKKEMIIEKVNTLGRIYR